ncbi:aminotransferase class V-fold PLP-dependent enzyme, partial [Brasilonema sp. CT11]|nr:aminotransferase class V-fold PLP-dependent enzyme [Brasilonema sp. CT11]
MEGLGDLCHKNDCLLVIDTVTSLGGVPVFLDAWGVDAAYSCTQKCWSCP